MGRIVANFFIALDGVVEAPEQWHMAYVDDEMMAVVGAGMEVNKAFLMGRTGYEGSAAFWPEQTGPFADFFNDIPKYVISSSLTDPAWKNTTVVPGEVEAVRRMKDGVDGDIFMTGSATTVRWLLANGLLDELQLLLHPVTVGKGHRLFDGPPAHQLELVRSTPFASGVVHLVYRPAA